MRKAKKANRTDPSVRFGEGSGSAGSLAALRPGEYGTVRALADTGPMRRRLLDIGLIAGTVVLWVGRSPCGDPSAYQIRGAVIALRASDACRVLLR